MVIHNSILRYTNNIILRYYYDLEIISTRIQYSLKRNVIIVVLNIIYLLI